MNRRQAVMWMGAVAITLRPQDNFNLKAAPPRNAFEARVSVPNSQTDRSRRPTSDDADGEAKRKRQREGTSLVDVTGSFRERSERFLFRQVESGREYRVLENLALERVSRALSNHSENRFWVVSGTITEFHGENYLIITRAVLKSQTNTPATGRGD